MKFRESEYTHDHPGVVYNVSPHDRFKLAHRRNLVKLYGPARLNRMREDQDR